MGRGRKNLLGVLEAYWRQVLTLEVHLAPCTPAPPLTRAGVGES